MGEILKSMQEKVGLKWFCVHFDEDTLTQGIEEILKKRFTNQELIQTIEDLYDPYLLAGMKEAVERVKIAIHNKERIIVFGDYDVDGVTSTAILMHFFKTIRAQVSYRLPHRVKDGYGLKKYFIDDIHTQWVKLLITVDCGTRDIEVVKYAKSLWIDVIITDHHAVPEVISEEAIAVINPKRKDCNYPFKWLSGAGVAFKLMMALAREYFPEKESKKYILESIDIAAIGTVADCMSLTWENRIIVQEGLKQLKNSRSKWIRKLIEHKIEEDLDADIFGFLIGPRLNAAGRMDTPYKALHLILDQEESVMETLMDIEMLNDKRRKMTHLFFNDALEKVNPQDNILIYTNTEIEHGIIWIVAGRLTEQYYKPAIVLTQHGENYVGSCRSPDFFDIVEILEKYKDFFVAFWWHKQAAGFTIQKAKFEEFTQVLLRDMNTLEFKKFKKNLLVDRIVGPQEIGFQLLNKITQFKPFWIGNPKPIFMIQDFEFETVGYLWKWVEHIKFTSRYGYKICWFWFWEHLDTIKKSKGVSIVFDISEDNFNGKKSLMLKMIDIVLS